ncbi:hypothetical protein NOCARDAX2BIS_540019 [Nocardioides sp. AX2bis]|nr:hypothetical protein NOCARDAX2BIS_540019 [Nocardioides sp. AX2bis]
MRCEQVEEITESERHDAKGIRALSVSERGAPPNCSSEQRPSEGGRRPARAKAIAYAPSDGWVRQD